MYTYDYPRPSVTVDVAIFKPLREDYQLLLIRRAHSPFKGKYALPGGFINLDESLEEAAHRELLEETGVENIHLTQIHTFSDPGRDPRGHVISTCFGCILEPGHLVHIKAGDDAAGVKWCDLTALPPLAFDHSIQVQSAIDKLFPSF